MSEQERESQSSKEPSSITGSVASARRRSVKVASEFVSSTTRRVASTRRRAAGILTRAEKISVRRRLIIVALSVILGAAAVSAIANYFAAAHTAEEAVEDYMHNMEYGNYLQTIDRSAYGHEDYLFLKNSMYRAAQDRVQEFHIDRIETWGERARAQVTAVVDGQEQQVGIDLVLEHHGGLLDDSWRLASAPQTMVKYSSNVNIDRLLVNGQMLKAAKSSTDKNTDPAQLNVALLPGKFTIDLPEDSYYTVVGGAVQTEVPLVKTPLADQTIKVRPSERMWSETDTAITEWTDECLLSRSLETPHCPSSAKYNHNGIAKQVSAARVGSTASPSTGAHKIDDVEWTLVDRPALWLLQDAQSGNSWHASKYKPATFLLTYTMDGKQMREEIQVNIDATVVSSGSVADISVGMEKKTASK